nr:efflux RND transporter permease subunit [FCB group bacterium]
IILKPGGMMGGEEADLSIEITGFEMDQLSKIADEVVEIAKGVRGVVEPRSSWRTGKPEIRITPKRELMADQNLSVSNLAVSMRSMIEGQEVSKYREGSREYDIRIKLREDDLNRIEEIPDFNVITSGGPQKIENLAKIEYTEGPTQIQRKNKQRLVTVSAEITGTTVGQAQTIIQASIDSLKIPEGYNIRFGGQSEYMAEAFVEMGRALLLAIILTYMLLAAIMESYIHPFTIMMTLPLGLIGVLYALFLTGNSISIISLMAIIMLVGIVVNNGILLIDYIKHLREEQGYNLKEAILEASPTRLRPIIMVNLATALGMTPLALGLGSGGEFRAPMAISSIGGLITSTLFTLFLIPAIYYTFESWKEKIAGRKKNI